MALGAKDSGEPLNSEDMALIEAVAGQVATAFENGRLYHQLQLKAGELDRERSFNENIIESLDDGLLVAGLDDRVVRWNPALESLYGVSRADAVGPAARRAVRRGAPLARSRTARRERDTEEAALYRVPLMSRHADGAARAAGQRRRRRRCARAIGAPPEHDRHPRGHHLARAARGAAADLGEDGVDRPARRRRRARGEHAADRHLELHADAARGRRSRRSADQAAREDRAADVPRREDRQRPAQPGAAARRSIARRSTCTP